MDIKQKIRAWDGKSFGDIEAIYWQYYSEADFVDTIVKLIKEACCQKGASWLLKKWFESGKKINSEHTADVYNSLQALQDWESKLHILQSIPYMPIEKNKKKKVESFLRATLTDSNKFVRAWSYNGFYELAMQYPEYLDEIGQFFEMALKDEAPSVKARIRNIMKKGSRNC